MANVAVVTADGTNRTAGEALAEDSTTKEGGLTPFGRAIDRRIKELQVEQPDLTRDLVAKRAGMSRQHLWRAQRGRSSFSAYELAQLVRVLGMEPQEAYEVYWKSHSDPATWQFAEFFDFLKWGTSPGSADDRKRVAETGLPDGASLVVQQDELTYHSPEETRRRHERRMRFARESARQNALRMIPRHLSHRVHDFREEAVTEGADEQEMAFIDSVLTSPENIFRQSGFRDEPNLSEEQQVEELEAVIAMLRTWLRQHMQKRGATA